MIIAGNLIRHRPQESSGAPGADIALAAVTSQTPVGVAFQIGELVDHSRAEAAEKFAQCLERARAGEHQTVVVGMGHGTATCQGASKIHGKLRQ